MEARGGHVTLFAGAFLDFYFAHSGSSDDFFSFFGGSLYEVVSQLLGVQF